MKKKKVLSTILIGTIITATVLCGCGSTTTETSESSTVITTETLTTTASGNNILVESEDSSSFIGTTFMATVESVDGTTLTVSAMGNMDGGEVPKGDGQQGTGEAPSGEAPSGDEKQDGGEAPSGDGQAPSTDDQSKPSGDGQAPSGDDQSKPSDDGQAPSGDGQQQGGGEAPSGEKPSGTTLTLTIEDDSIISDSEGNAVSLLDLAAGDFITVEVSEDGIVNAITIGGGMEMPMGGGMGGAGASSAVESYDAVTEITEDETLEDETIASTGTDENAIHVFNGATAYLNKLVLTKLSSDSTGGDNSSFYGVGAALLVTDGTAYIDSADITTDSAGGAGVFAYGDGIAYVANSKITTTSNTSGGIHAAGGGTLYAWDCEVETNGESSAAIRSDRGGGTMVVDGGTYTSNGTGSPAVYCTANIAINDADLEATGSEAICIEGLNELHLYNCNLTGDMPENSQNDVTWNVIVYQSMSGDSEVGNGVFTMVGGTLTANNGGMFYTTNTESTFYISDVDITYSASNDFFLRVTGNANARGWGSTGANGADCNFTADSQEMVGDIIFDSISTLDFYMLNGSTLTGAVIDDESAAGNGGSGYANLYISEDSTWVVTGDSVVTNLYNAGVIVDSDGNAVTVVGTDGTVYVQGESQFTITVESYFDTADLSGATDGGSFSDYEIENPF